MPSTSIALSRLEAQKEKYLNKTFNGLTCVEVGEVVYWQRRAYARYGVFRCHCGNLKRMKLEYAIKGITKSCGCLLKKRPRGIVNKPISEADYIGKKWGRLTLVKLLPLERREDGKGAIRMALFRCDCGSPDKVLQFKNVVRSKSTVSCGCRRRRVILSEAPLSSDSIQIALE